MKTLLLSLTVLFPLGANVAQAQNENCEDVVLHSAATPQVLSTRGADVKRCLVLADAVAIASYRQTLPYCKNMALANPTPQSLTLTSQTTLEPSPNTQSWDEFAMTMGQDAATSGCRDGILAALQQTLFLNTARVQSLFVDSQIVMKDELVGNFEVEGPFGLSADLSITSSNTNGRFLDIAQIQALGDGRLNFSSSPFQLTISGVGSVGSLGASTPLTFTVDVEGFISGEIDSKSLKAQVSHYQVSRVFVRGHSPFNAGLSTLIETILQQKESAFVSDISRELTQQLLVAYRSTDPFSFLTSKL